MAMNVGGPTGRVRPEMNVTPLVDVVLVLLIIFMVVMPMMTEKFWLQVPKDEENPPPPPPDAKPPIVLYLDKTGALTLNSEKVAKGELKVRLERAISSSADGVVFFDAHYDADYALAVEAMDLAKAAGAASVAIVPQGIETAGN
jgi:biopolymer transport protein ExbD